MLIFRESSRPFWNPSGAWDKEEITIPGKLRPDLSRESLIWRPVLAGKVTMTELKLGLVNLVDLLKINALLDMEADIQRYAAEHPKKDGDEH